MDRTVTYTLPAVMISHPAYVPAIDHSFRTNVGNDSEVLRVLAGKPEGNRPLGRPKRRWEDNIKLNLQEVACEGMDRIDLAQDREIRRALVNAVMKFWVP